MKKDHLAKKEYRYGCSIDCGGTPLRVYARELGSQGNWSSYEDYLSAPTFVWYNNSDGSSSDYAWLPGHWLSEQQPPGEGRMYYQDSFGVQVVGGDFDPQAPIKRLPEYLMGEEAKLLPYLPELYSLRYYGAPKKCTIQEFRQCKASCKNMGGFYAGCYWQGGKQQCVCGNLPEKPCLPSEMIQCKEKCATYRGVPKWCKKGPIGIIDCECATQTDDPRIARWENSHE
jgi:hypothetical protein